MKTFNNFKEASKQYRALGVKSLTLWREKIVEGGIRVRQLIEEDRRIKDAIIRGLVNFFKINKEGDVTERTERRVAPIDGYERKTDRKQNDTYKMFDLVKLKKFIEQGIEEEKAKLMSIISFNRWQFEHEI